MNKVTVSAASDPNIEPENLIALINSYSVEALTNPVLPFIAMERPELFDNLNVYGVDVILANENIAPDWLVIKVLTSSHIKNIFFNMFLKQGRWNYIRNKYPVPEGKMINMRYILFESVDLTNINLSHCDLKGSLFQNVKMINTDFSYSNLTSTKTFRCEVKNVNAEGACLSYSSFLMEDIKTFLE